MDTLAQMTVLDEAYRSSYSSGQYAFFIIDTVQNAHSREYSLNSTRWRGRSISMLKPVLILSTLPLNQNAKQQYGLNSSRSASDRATYKMVGDGFICA